MVSLYPIPVSYLFDLDEKDGGGRETIARTAGMEKESDGGVEGRSRGRRKERERGEWKKIIERGRNGEEGKKEKRGAGRGDKYVYAESVTDIPLIELFVRFCVRSFSRENASSLSRYPIHQWLSDKG